jgi:hypothetical protein
MSKVFISHTHEQRDNANDLAMVLEKFGFQPLRVWESTPGTEWQAEILSSIRRCSAILVLIDDISPSVMLEVGYALGAGKRVVLVGSPETRVPFDMASLPLVRMEDIDFFSVSRLAGLLHVRLGPEPGPEPDPSDSAYERLERMLGDSEFMDAVSPRDFEILVSKFFVDLGLSVSPTQRGSDAGYDLSIKVPESNTFAVVEVKKNSRSSRIGVAHVHQLVGAATLAGARGGILISTSGFTASALSMATSGPVPVVLVTLEELLQEASVGGPLKEFFSAVSGG